ncbi:MAG: uroporphyrinogen-III synthase [Burkholderiales bacterium]
MSAGPLAGKRILVTRPRGQAAGLAARIREAGGEPVLFPAIEITDLADLNPFFDIADRLEHFDLAIFISPTAVQRALALLRVRRKGLPWPARLQLAAIGRGSRRELKQRGLSGVLAPPGGADSEALLALPGLADVAGKHVVIFRGQDGRELLGDTLTARGARVEYAECYRRARPEPGVSAPEPAWAREALDAVTVSSSEALANLDAMLREWRRGWLQESPLFVPHPRVAEEAARLGARETVVAGPGDREIVLGLLAYFHDAK